MTTIVGIQGPTWAVIGGDSRVVDGGKITDLPKNAGKIFRKNEYIVAIAGDFRVGQILQHAFDYPKPPDNLNQEGMDRWMTAEFIPLLQEHYKEMNYTVDNDLGSEVLIAISGIIYALDQDWTWARDRRGIYAAGSGQAYAYGALSAYNFPKSASDATSIIKQAIKISASYDVNTAEPAIVFSQEP